MLIDVIIGNDEIGVLELRLRELWDVVDRFVIVEHDHTFRGFPKPFYLREHFLTSDCFWAAQKVHWVSSYDETTTGLSAWEREAAQRNNAWKTTREYFEQSGRHTYMWGDLDEIPSAAAVRHALDHEALVLGFRQRMHYGSLGWYAPGGWVGTRMVKPWPNRAMSGQEWRQYCPDVVIDGGWHCSYFGGLEAIRAKTAAYSHSEWDGKAGELHQSFQGGWNPFDHGRKMLRAPLHEAPIFAQQDPSRWGLETQ